MADLTTRRDRVAEQFTPMETRIMEILKDGRSHPRKQILLALDPDGLMDKTALANHISSIRRKIPRNQDVVCAYKQRMFRYQLVYLVGRER